jgi:hypothetical protein
LIQDLFRSRGRTVETVNMRIADEKDLLNEGVKHEMVAAYPKAFKTFRVEMGELIGIGIQEYQKDW